MPAPLQQIVPRRVKLAHNERGHVVTASAGPGTSTVDFSIRDHPMDGTYVHLDDVVAVLEGYAAQVKDESRAFDGRSAADAANELAEWFKLRPL